jgi:hypothetical protein
MRELRFPGMATQEFYVRNEPETEARGPFNLEQLLSLAENGQVTAETLYYEASTEQWTAISENAELKAAIFPEKKKLQMRTKGQAPTMVSAASDSRPPITVDDMLAAAEGRTADTKDRLDPAIAMARAAAIGCWSGVLMLLLSAAGGLLPSIDFLMKFKVEGLLDHPLVIFGVIDVMLAVLLMLGMVAAYPLVRFRAAIGLGFLGFVFFTQGQMLPLLAIAGGAVSLYLSTICVSLLSVIVVALIGIAGMAGVAWQMISTT